MQESIKRNGILWALSGTRAANQNMLEAGAGGGPVTWEDV